MAKGITAETMEVVREAWQTVRDSMDNLDSRKEASTDALVALYKMKNFIDLAETELGLD